MPAQKKLLVVDDDNMVRMLIPALLREKNWHIRSASDGAQAIDQLADQPPDVLVLDLMMPGVDGYGVLRHLRRAAPHLLKRTIVLTAFVGKTPEQIDENEIFRLMRKPFQMKDLVAVILACAESGPEPAGPPTGS